MRMVRSRHWNGQKEFSSQAFRRGRHRYTEGIILRGGREITQIQVTPPAAFEFVRALEEKREMSCVTCKKCGYPHLDLGGFAVTPHLKHFCGNCGNDSVRSEGKIVSTPLKPLHDQFNNSNTYITPDRAINLDDYPDKEFELWSSTPAVVWTADRPQEHGIHVHIYEGAIGTHRIVDNTFGQVIYKGNPLDRKSLWEEMTNNTLY